MIEIKKIKNGFLVCHRNIQHDEDIIYYNSIEELSKNLINIYKDYNKKFSFSVNEPCVL